MRFCFGAGYKIADLLTYLLRPTSVFYSSFVHCSLTVLYFLFHNKIYDEDDDDGEEEEEEEEEEKEEEEDADDGM